MAVSLSAPLAGAASNDADAGLRALLGEIVHGDQAALGKLYDQTLGRVYAIALRVLRQPADAEEVVCDVFMQVWEQAGSFSPERGTVLAWLTTLAWSRAVDRQRRLRHRNREEPLHPDEGEAAYTACEDRGLDPYLAAWQETEALQRALSQLSPAQRNVLQLAYFEDLSHVEISERTGLPLGTVKSHARRGMAQLKQVLGVQENEA